MSLTDSPFFSIIVPIYNRSKFIPTLINTILQQDFTDFEVIIVNDGSTDETILVLEGIENSQIKCFSIPNSERGAARNFGALRAQGKYLNFFDSDDQMGSNHLSSAYSFCLKESFPKWFHTCYGIKNGRGEILKMEYGVATEPEKRLIKTNYLGCNSVFVERFFFLDNQFCPDRVLASSEDWELWLRLISREPLKRCPVVTYFMLQHDGRSLLTISPDHVISRDTFMLKKLLSDGNFLQKFRNHLKIFEADRYTFFALSLLEADRKSESFNYLIRSLMTTSKVLFRKRFLACWKNLIFNSMRILLKNIANYVKN